MIDEEYVWIAAYVHAQREHIRDGGDGWPEVIGAEDHDALEVLLSLVNLAIRIRHITRKMASPLEMAANELAYVTDEMLAVLTAPLDEDADAAIVDRWRQTLAEVEELLDLPDTGKDASGE